MRRSGGCSTRRSTPSPVLECSAPTPRSCSRPAMSRRRRPPPKSSRRSPPSSHHRSSGRRRRTPPVRSSSREGRAKDALLASRKALKQWTELEAPHEAARTRALIADACAAVGDTEGAELARSAARSTFEALGAAPDLARLGPGDAPGRPDGLTSREVEVLRVLAEGKDEPGHRREAVHQREDGGESREPHLHQARCVVTRRGHGLRVRPRPCLVSARGTGTAQVVSHSKGRGEPLDGSLEAGLENCCGDIAAAALEHSPQRVERPA